MPDWLSHRMQRHTLDEPREKSAQTIEVREIRLIASVSLDDPLATGHSLTGTSLLGPALRAEF